MFNRSYCDRKSQLSGILTEPLNPRALKFRKKIEKSRSKKKIVFYYKINCHDSFGTYKSYYVQKLLFKTENSFLNSGQF